VDEIIVGGWNAIDQIFKDDRELLDELLGFCGDREGAIVDSG
jgi:hypothetical protein